MNLSMDICAFTAAREQAEMFFLAVTREALLTGLGGAYAELFMPYKPKDYPSHHKAALLAIVIALLFG